MPLDDQFCRRPRNRRQQPLQPAFPATYSSRHRPSAAINSSCPSVTRNISLIGATHALGNSRRCSTAENTARAHSRSCRIFRSTESTAPGSLRSSVSNRVPRSPLTTLESTRNPTNSIQERSCALGTKFAKSSAKRPAISLFEPFDARKKVSIQDYRCITGI